MWKDLKTKRLSIQQLTENDFEAFHAINSNPEVMKFIKNGKPKTEKENQDEFKKIRENYKKCHELGYWGIVESISKKIIGIASLKAGKHSKNLELGYKFNSNSWGKGFATEATIALLNYGFFKLNQEELAALTYIDNKKSIHVLEKVGMLFKTHVIHNDKKCNFYTIAKKDFIILKEKSENIR